MNKQSLKFFIVALTASFLGCFFALALYNSRLDVGKLFLPSPAKPVEANPQVANNSSADPIAQAQQEMREAYKTACAPEIGNFCAKGNLGGVIPCLLDQETLSPSCKNSLLVYTERYKPCDAEIKALCSGLKFGGGRIHACLKKNKDRISSPACLQVIAN